jgi:hypothetical protein
MRSGNPTLEISSYSSVTSKTPRPRLALLVGVSLFGLVWLGGTVLRLLGA